ncbi:MAG: restriction endonuclease subunit R, partial [Candidatus Nitrotoga sp.]
DTYIEAKTPRTISNFGDIGLLQLIAGSGMAAALDTLPDAIKRSPQAVAETIANNVRSIIVKEHLNDPAFYDKMSTLLDEIIAARKSKAIEYEAYLKRIAELIKRVEAGQAEDMPVQLNTPGRRALYNIIMHGLSSGGTFRVADSGSPAGSTPEERALDLSIQIDGAVKHVRSDGWRGIQAREQIIKGVLYGVLQDADAVEKIFLIMKQQREY